MRVTFLSEDFIRDLAYKVAAEFGLHQNIPVPIEEVIEKQGIDIIPIPGLQDRCDTDGLITSDMLSIYVDEYCYLHRHNRYRFTLAHELGHLILHAKIYEDLKFDDIEGWIRFHDMIDQKEYSRIEIQGNIFAGYLLVPSKHLSTQFELQKSLNSSMIAEASKSGVSRNIYLNYVIEYISKELSSVFQVSPDVIKIRIKSEGLDNLI